MMALSQPLTFKIQPLSIAVLIAITSPCLALANTTEEKPSYKDETFPTLNQWTVSESLNSGFINKKLASSSLIFQPYKDGFNINGDTVVYTDNTASIKQYQDNLIRIDNSQLSSFLLNHSTLRLLHENSQSSPALIRIDNSEALFIGKKDSSFQLLGKAERAIFVKSGSMKIQSGNVWIQQKPAQGNPSAIVQVESGASFSAEANQNLVLLSDQSGTIASIDGILNSGGKLFLTAPNIFIGAIPQKNDTKMALLNLNGDNTIGTDHTEVIALHGGKVGIQLNNAKLGLTTQKLQIVGDGSKDSVGIKLIGEDADHMTTKIGDAYLGYVSTGLHVFESTASFVFDRLWNMASENSVLMDFADLDLTVNQYAYFDKDIKANEGYLRLRGDGDFIVNGSIHLDNGSRLFGSPQSLSVTQLTALNKSSVEFDLSHILFGSNTEKAKAIVASSNSTISINTKNAVLSNINVLGNIEISNGANVSIGFLNEKSGFNGTVLTSVNKADQLGEAHLTFKNGAQWKVNGTNTHPVALTVDKGQVYLADSALSQKTLSDPVTLTLSSLSGTNGLFVMRTSVQEAKGDSIMVGQGGGQHQLSLSSLGTEPNEASLNRPLVTQTTGNMSLTLVNGQIDLGNHVYYLANRETDSGTEWYLTRGKPDTPVTPSTPLSPSASAVLALAGAGAQNTQFLYGLSNLRERMGDVRYQAADGLYATIRGGKDRISGFASTSFKNTYGAASIGFDNQINQNWIAGVSFEAIKGDQKVSKGAYHADGEDKTQSLKFYSTWFNDVGYYTDLVIGVNQFSQDIATNMLDGRKVDGNYSSYGWGASAEIGRKIAFGAEDTWFIEPQAQLAYFYVNGKDFRLSNGMSIQQDNAKSLTGRLGFSAGRTVLDKNGAGFQVTFKTGIQHEFLEDTAITINDEKFEGNSLGTRAYYGFAMDWYLSDHVRLFGQIEREEGTHYTSEINAKLGLKYKF